MNRAEIFEKLNAVFRDVLDVDSILLTEATKANEIEQWDSLSHVTLVVAIEKVFKVRFTLAQIQSWTNVGDLVRDITGHLNKR
jgi:acyl carrier protein